MENHKMRKALFISAALALSGCASTEEFKEGSKMLGSLLWESAGNTSTRCTFVSGHGNVCYQMPNELLTESLTVEERAEIESREVQRIIDEREHAEQPPTI